MMKKITFFISLSLFVFFTNCKQEKKSAKPEKETSSTAPLASWDDGKIKDNIISFVEKVTTEGSPDFVPVEDRVATFDNDGTLWAEKPVTFQLLYALDQVKKMSAEHPEWKSNEPFKSVLADDMEGLFKSGEKGFAKILVATQANINVEDYKASVKDWIKTAKHPKYNKPYNSVVYQPMLELLSYLKENGFTNYIISGGDIDFMRPWATETYGVPSNRVIGSTFAMKYNYNDGEASIERLPEIEFANRGDGKPVGINRHIGKRPIFAAGNSDGDLQMFQYTAANNHPNFNLLIHHTDSIREYMYGKKSVTGKLNVALDEAIAKGWTVVDMKKDWNKVFSFDK